MRLCEIVEPESIRSMEPLGCPVERICAAKEPVPRKLSISIPTLVFAPKRRATSKEPEKNSPVDEPLVCKLPCGYGLAQDARQAEIGRCALHATSNLRSSDAPTDHKAIG